MNNALLNDGLIHYWPIDNSLKDVIGNADMFNGINVTLAYDRFNKTNSSLGFNSGYIQVPNDVYFNVPFTISLWVYATPSFNLNIPDTTTTTTTENYNETTDYTNFFKNYENETTVEMSTTTTPKIYTSSYFSLFEFTNDQNNYVIMNCFYLPQLKSFSPIIYISGAYGAVFSYNSANINEWVHLAAVYDGKYGFVYVNGHNKNWGLKKI
jgi:hypothetical protein